MEIQQSTKSVPVLQWLSGRSEHTCGSDYWEKRRVTTASSHWIIAIEQYETCITITAQMCTNNQIYTYGFYRWISSYSPIYHCVYMVYICFPHIITPYKVRTKERHLSWIGCGLASMHMYVEELKGLCKASVIVFWCSRSFECFNG